MGTPRLPLPVKPICGLLSADDDLLRRARQMLVRLWGPVEFETPVWPFWQTTYYEREMGKDLKRQFLAFERLVSPEALAQLKRDSNAIEQQIAEECLALEIERPVNIDPGLIDPARLILATTKDRAHRIYVGQGIYAEVTLYWTEGAWHPSAWTYPDYREPAYHEFFSRVRTRLAEQRRVAHEFDGQSPA